MAKSMGPFPGYKDTRASGVKKTVDTTNEPYMLEVIELHRSHVGEDPGQRPLRLPQGRSAEVLGRRARARQEARLPQRAGHRARAHRHHRLPHGLRHHRHRARHRAGEIQAARRRRHAEDRQPDGEARAAAPRLRRRARSTGIIAHIDKYDTIEDVHRRQTARPSPAA